MKKLLLLTAMIVALSLFAAPAIAQSDEATPAAETTESSEEGNSGLWGLLGLAGLAGLLGRRRNDTPRSGGASRMTLAVLGLTAVLLLGSSTGALAQTDDAAAQEDDGIDGRWGLLGLLGLPGLLGYRNDKDRDRDRDR